MIPKIIHFCWFGGGTYNKLIEYCMDSWTKNLPDYEIIKWDESRFDVLSVPFVKSAYENKKWAFVSDYVRAYALYHHGGIYLDTDVEIKLPLEPFLAHRAFSGFEKTFLPFTAVWGAEKNHPWPKCVLEYYHGQEEFSLKTNTQIVSELLTEKYTVDIMNNVKQELADGIVIYPSDTFCVDIPLNYASHHFNGSWLEKEDDHVPFKDYYTFDYYQEKYFNLIRQQTNLNPQQELVKRIKISYLVKEILYRIKSKFRL